ncbi:MAG: PAS domain S-box protein, partial [candidate division WOR-3 bacterium]|nr:PAS domain S-box protein [candidate division WOR-3 bacterium]
MNKLGPEELFKTIFERLPLASFSCDAEGVVLAWNEAAERLYGYKKEDALGREIVDLILLPDESDEEEDLIRQVFSGHEL